MEIALDQTHSCMLYQAVPNAEVVKLRASGAREPGGAIYSCNPGSWSAFRGFEEAKDGRCEQV